MHQHNCVSLVPLFSQLSEQEQDTVNSIVHQHHYQTGETIFAAGDSMDALMIIASGQAKVFQLASNGKEQLLHLLTAGDFDGETALFSQAKHNSFAEALMPTMICQINRTEFQQLMQKYPTISLNLLNELGRRMTELEKCTTQTSTSSVESRLADYLVETSAQFGKNDFKLPLKKKDLATYLGTTPETISRKLGELERNGLIEQTGSKQICIVDQEALEML